MVLESSPDLTKDVHLARRLRQEDRGLAGRVPAAHHGHLLITAELRLDVGGAVVDPPSFELLETQVR
jgi:hypothetical protein